MARKRTAVGKVAKWEPMVQRKEEAGMFALRGFGSVVQRQHGKLTGVPGMALGDWQTSQKQSEGCLTEVVQRQAEQPAENKTGLPDDLKAGVESLSGYDLSGVRVNYNSSKPAQVQAHAYTQGQTIEVAQGQEKHLPHEAWHVVQQMQGRVKPTMQMKGVGVNEDARLEREADVMGQRAVQTRERVIEKPERSEENNSVGNIDSTVSKIGSTLICEIDQKPVVQRKVGFEFELNIPVWSERGELEPKEPIGKCGPITLVVDTNTKLKEAYEGAVRKREVTSPKPDVAQKGRIVEMVTPAIDEFDEDADEQLTEIIGRAASTAKTLEKYAKSGHAENLPLGHSIIFGFNTTSQELLNAMSATAFIQATVGVKMDGFAELSSFASDLLKPKLDEEGLDAQKRERAEALLRIMVQANTNATEILSRLNEIHSEKVKTTEAQPAQTSNPKASELSLTTSNPAQGLLSTPPTFKFGTPSASTPSQSAPRYTFGTAISDSSSGTFHTSDQSKIKGIDLTSLKDLSGFFEILCLQILGSKIESKGNAKNMTSLLNRAGLDKAREQALSEQSRIVISIYSHEIQELMSGVNAVNLGEDMGSGGEYPTYGDQLSGVLTGKTDQLFTAIMWRNSTHDLLPEEVGPKGGKRTKGAVFEFRHIAQKLPPENWLDFAKNVMEKMREINQ